MPLRVWDIPVCLHLSHGLTQGPPLRGAFPYAAAQQAIPPRAADPGPPPTARASGAESEERSGSPERERPWPLNGLLPRGGGRAAGELS